MASREELYNDSEQALSFALDGRQAQMWTAGPGIVQAIDFATMTLTVQPAIQGVLTDEVGVKTYVNMPLLVHVPIQYPTAGGFSLTLPVKVNDEVLVVFASRCIDAWWQSGGVQKPMELRMHDLSDGFAILGVRSKPNVITSISTTGAQFRNEAGTTYVEIASDGKIKLTSSVQVLVTGDLKVTGKIEADGEVTAHKATVPVNLSTHTHPGVTVGSGSTGAGVG